MDLIGTVMGFVTIPMSLFTLSSLGAGLVLIATGDGRIVLLGFGAFIAAACLAILLERIVMLIDDRAIATRIRHGLRAARPWAAVSGVLPMVMLLGWELIAHHEIMAAPASAPRIMLWLWSYGVATGPWTLFALLVGSDRRTLCGIRAYAGHLAYWLLSLLVTPFGVAETAAGALMLLPAILPISVGYLLAIADRDALHNVRI